MPHFTQMHAVNEEATLNLLRRSYNDFCRDAAVEARPSGREIPRTSSSPMTHCSPATVSSRASARRPARSMILIVATTVPDAHVDGGKVSHLCCSIFASGRTRSRPR